MYNWIYLKNNPGCYSIEGSREICLLSEETETGEILVYECIINAMHKTLADSSKWIEQKFKRIEENNEIPAL